MRFNVKQVFAGLMILALSGVMALAKVKKDSITFFSDVTVDGAKVKAGTYDLRFDDQTGQLEILKDSKVVAKTNTHLEKRSEKAHTTEFQTSAVDGMHLLVSVAFRGQDENIVVGQSSTSTTGN